METWKCCRVCPFTGLENIYHAKKPNCLWEASRNIASPWCDQDLQPCWVQGKSLRHPHLHPACSQWGSSEGVPAAPFGSRSQVLCSGGNTRLGRHHILFREGSVWWCSGLLSLSWWAGGPDGNRRWCPESSKPCPEEERGLTSGTGLGKWKDLLWKESGCGRTEKLPSI